MTKQRYKTFTPTYNTGKRNLEKLGLTRVGPKAWLKLSHSHRIIKANIKNQKFSEYEYYKAGYGKQDSYVDVRGGWREDKELVLISNFAFDVSYRDRTPEQLKRLRDNARIRKARKL